MNTDCRKPPNRKPKEVKATRFAAYVKARGSSSFKRNNYVLNKMPVPKSPTGPRLEVLFEVEGFVLVIKIDCHNQIERQS